MVEFWKTILDSSAIWFWNNVCSDNTDFGNEEEGARYVQILRKRWKCSALARIDPLCFGRECCQRYCSGKDRSGNVLVLDIVLETKKTSRKRCLLVYVCIYVSIYVYRRYSDIAVSGTEVSGASVGVKSSGKSSSGKSEPMVIVKLEMAEHAA